jgi:altronate dehydratase large subunit
MSTYIIAPENQTDYSTPENLIWRGYRRSDGRVGCRNHLIVLSTVALTDRLAQQICENNELFVPVVGAFSRGLQQQDEKILDAFIEAVVFHPNVGGALILTHDRQYMEKLKNKLPVSNSIKFLSFMSCAGREQAVEAGKLAGLELSRQIKTERQSISFSDLCVALECGGSDVSSSICSNPMIGVFSDRLAQAGGSIVVSETAEFIGAEAIFNKRCSDNNVKKSILNFIQKKEKLMSRDTGKDYRGTNPTNENIEGGLTTLIEKSMGAVSKTGTSKFVSAIGFGERVNKPGLHFMDTPFFSPVSLTGMMMAGCTIGLFAMGVYNPSGNMLCPTIKICGNPKTLQQWSGEIDIDLSLYFLGQETQTQALSRITKEINLIFGGKPSIAEKNKEGQFMLTRSLEAL